MSAYKRTSLLSDVARTNLNAAVRELSVNDRRAAVAILARYGAMTPPEIKTEDVAACTAEFVAALNGGGAS